MIRPPSARPPRGGSGRGSRARLLKALIERQQSRCFYCRYFMQRSNPRSPLFATLDEKLPRWMGGKVDEANCVAACATCNNRKGPLDADTFIALRHDTAKMDRALRAAHHLARMVSLGDPMSKQRLETALRAARAAP